MYSVEFFIKLCDNIKKRFSVVKNGAKAESLKNFMMNYPLTLAQILEHAYRIHADKQVTTLLPDGVLHRYNYATLYERVKRLANALTELGVQCGDRVATYASNTYQHLELYYAIPCIGAVLHPLNVRLSPTQLAHIVREAEDKLIFVDGVFVEQFKALRDKIVCKQAICFDLKSADTDILYEELLSETTPTCTWDIQDENWAMGLCYTSGTHGEPRGVLYTHRSMFLHTLAVNQANVFGLTEADVVLPLVRCSTQWRGGCLTQACLLVQISYSPVSNLRVLLTLLLKRASPSLRVYRRFGQRFIQNYAKGDRISPDYGD